MNTKESRARLRTISLALAVCAALILGFMAGCTRTLTGEDRTTERPPAEDTGLKLNLYQPHQARGSLWQELAADYKNLTGVNVAVTTPRGGAPATELKEALKGETDQPAIFLFTSPREYKAWQDNAHDLTGSAAYQRLADSRLALTAGDKIVGLPLGVEAYGIVCNTKLLGDYFALEGKKTDFNSINDIKDYKDLEALVKDLEANKPELGIDGVFAAPAYKEGESAAWGTRLMSVPVGYEIESKKIDVTGDKIGEITLGYETGY